MRRILGIAATLAALVMTPAADAAQKIHVGRPTAVSVADAPLAMAWGMGYFAEEGLDVDLTAFKGSANLMAQMLSGRVQIGYLRPDALVAARRENGQNGPPLAFFYDMDRAWPWQLLVAAKSPIRGLHQLGEQRIGVGALTYNTVPFINAILRDVGYGEGSVEIVPVGVGPGAYRALAAGEVDALLLSDTQRAAMKQDGARLRRLDLPPAYAGMPSGGFVARQEMIAGDPETLGAFGRAVAKGTLACETNRPACVAMFWRSFHAKKPAVGSEKEQVEEAVGLLAVRLGKLLAFPPGEPPRYGAFPDVAWERMLAVLAPGTGESPDIRPESLYTNALVPAFNRFQPEPVVAAAAALSVAEQSAGGEVK